MKKLLVLALLIASVTFIFADESDFSDVVGYVKLESSSINTQFFTPIFDAENVSFGDYLGDVNESTQILDITDNSSATNYSGVWYDDITYETPYFQNGHAYFITQSITEYYQFGKLFEGNVTITIGSGYTAFGLPVAKTFGSDELNLPGLDDSSQLLNISNNTSATCYGGVWYNDADFSVYNIEVGCAYWIYNLGTGTTFDMEIGYSEDARTNQNKISKSKINRK